MLPGIAFERPPSELTARIAFVDFDGARALSASETFPLDQPLPVDFADAWCGSTIEAVKRTADWAAS